MKYLFTAFLAMFSASTFAVGIGNDNPGGNSTQLQGQAQGQIQGQAQGQSVNVSNRITSDSRAAAAAFSKSNSASNSGNNSFVVNEAAIPANTTQSIHQDSYTVKGVPNVYGGNVFPTTNCAHSATVGGAGVGFGFSIGGSYLDDECSLRETARSFQLLNMVSDAVAVLCVSKYASAAPACKAISAAGGNPEPK
jgi:hypothetical protein